VWGLGYRYTHDVDVNAPALAFLPPVLNLNLYSAFAQDEVALGDGATLILGSKVEHNGYTGYEVEPNMRMRFELPAKQMIWAAVSRAVRTPSRIDTDLSEAAPPHLVLLKGGPNFKAETVVAYELGYRAQIGSRVTTSISAFYNDYNNVRSTTFTPVTVLPLYFANALEGNTHGVEVTAGYQALDWWQLTAGYDLLKENLGIKPGQTDINNALNETADPEHQVSIRSSMDLPGNVAFDTQLRWVDTLRINSGATLGEVPAYFNLNARLGWHPKKNLEISVSGRNLLYAHRPEYGYPSPTREEIARGVYGKVVWTY
jgi:iron complex outermembrane receptor protein